MREAKADINFFVGIVGSVFGDFDAVGHHLDDAPKHQDVGAVARRLLAVDHQPPLDTRRWA